MNISVQKWEMEYFKNEMISFIINFRWNYVMDKSMSKIEATVSKEFALFYWSSACADPEGGRGSGPPFKITKL